MNANKNNNLTDSEVQKLRNDIAETERRRWLFRLIRTGAAWTAGTLAAALSLMDGAMRLAEWVTKR